MFTEIRDSSSMVPGLVFEEHMQFAGIRKNILEIYYPSRTLDLPIYPFLRNYYDHTEKVYKETWEARKRLVNNENIIPPEHRPKNKNNIPNKMKTGK